jgi:hypothetical protein
MIASGGQPVSFFGGQLPSWVDVRIFAIAPGGERAYRAREWRNALVVVERGQLELRSLDDTRWHFERGATLFLAGLPIRALRNNGLETALICALSRAADRTAARSHSRRPSRARWLKGARAKRVDEDS